MLQSAFEDDLRIRRAGIILGDQQADSLSSNLRFADEGLLFSTSLNQLKKMMSDFKRSIEKVGLKIHPDKTKIFDKQRSIRQTEATIDDISVEIQPLSRKAQYLGQTISFEQQDTTEIKNRIRAAWASFARCRQGVDIKIVSSSTPTTFFQLGHHTDDDVRFRHMGVDA